MIKVAAQNSRSHKTIITFMQNTDTQQRAADCVGVTASLVRMITALSANCFSWYTEWK